ncbi:MAG TPA: TIGR03560 family F420-dependent LLM class oxidoreductase [Acidimicrobiia bacterium]
MRVGIDIAQQRMPWSEIADRATFADAAGFDSIWGFDHFQPMYGSGPGECFEGYTMLAALSGLTTRVRLGLLVTGVTYRHPSLLAAEAITVDHASEGRLELSLGAAWYEKEHRELGFPFPPTPQRIEMLDEALTILRGLLTTDGFSFHGRHFTVDDASLRPRPVQSPTPPLWIGASGERRMLPLVARHADGWHAFGSVDELTRKSRLLDDLAADAGRHPAGIVRAAWLDLSRPWSDVRREAEQLAGRGFGLVIAGWPSEGRAHVEDFATTVLPDLRELTP